MIFFSKTQLQYLLYKDQNHTTICNIYSCKGAIANMQVLHLILLFSFVTIYSILNRLRNYTSEKKPYIKLKLKSSSYVLL